jgi:fimbrial chaperone protein
LNNSYLYAVATAASLFVSANAGSGSFAVSPIRVELRVGQSAGELTVYNDSEQSTLIQVKAVEWAQAEGRENFSDTRDVLITPPVFTIQPGTEQVLRVALRKAPDAARELSYRLFVQEVPPTANPDAPQLTMALRISLPIFVAPVNKGAPKLEWQARLRDDGKLELQAINRGSVHMQITDFDLQLGVGNSVPGTRTNKYLLSGSSASWTIELPDGAGAAVKGTVIRVTSARLSKPSRNPGQADRTAMRPCVALPESCAPKSPDYGGRPCSPRAR